VSAATTSTAVASGKRTFVRTDRRVGETLFQGFLVVATLLVIASTFAILAYIVQTGLKGISAVGAGQLLTGRTWKPEANTYGGLPLIVGTFATAAGAIVVGAVPSILAALWVTEFAPKAIKGLYRRVMEVSVAIPSVVFGWLALVNLIPIMESVAHKLNGEEADVGGEGLGSASVLLGVMIAPTIVVMSLDALSRVPHPMRDASSALGASRIQTAFTIVLPHAWRGLLLAVFFGFARAAGETMAVQMVIGGARKMPEGLFTPTTTISTQVVMDMQNARPDTVQSDVLYSMALVLLVLSTGVVLLTRLLNREKR